MHNLIGNERSSSSTKVMLCNVGCGLMLANFHTGGSGESTSKTVMVLPGPTTWSDRLSYIDSLLIFCYDEKH